MITNPEPWLQDLLVYAGLEDMTDEEWQAALAAAEGRIDRHVYPVPLVRSPTLRSGVPRYEVPHLGEVQKNFRPNLTETEIDPNGSS